MRMGTVAYYRPLSRGLSQASFAKIGDGPHSGRLGVTLIELILVLAILATVAALGAPRLIGFFHGRNLNEEAGQLLSLIHYARSQAISTGEAVEVWIRPDEGAYGLGPADGYGAADGERRQFQAAEGLTLTVKATDLDAEGRARIVVAPDGSMEGCDVGIADRTGNGLTLQASELGFGYQIEEEPK